MSDKNTKGSYILIIKLAQPCNISVGRLGKISFPAGWYAYVGSAMRGFKARLPHHLSKAKRPHWHIDYLLQEAPIKEIITIESQQNIECKIAGQLMEYFDYTPGFGCSDCRCKSHLFFSNDVIEVKQNINIIKSYFFTMGIHIWQR